MGDSIAKRAVTEWFLYFVLTEEIPSDEDEVNENQQQQQLASPPGRSGAEDDDEDDYWDDDGFEGTPLEEYSTPLDFDNGEDEYLFFTSTLLRMLLHLSTGFNMYTHTPLDRRLLFTRQDSRTLMQLGTTRWWLHWVKTKKNSCRRSTTSHNREVPAPRASEETQWSVNTCQKSRARLVLAWVMVSGVVFTLLEATSSSYSVLFLKTCSLCFFGTYSCTVTKPLTLNSDLFLVSKLVNYTHMYLFISVSLLLLKPNPEPSLNPSTEPSPDPGPKSRPTLALNPALTQAAEVSFLLFS